MSGAERSSFSLLGVEDMLLFVRLMIEIIVGGESCVVKREDEVIWGYLCACADKKSDKAPPHARPRLVSLGPSTPAKGCLTVAVTSDARDKTINGKYKMCIVCLSIGDGNVETDDEFT